MPVVVPATAEGVVAAIVALALGASGRIRLAIDGAPASRPAELADLVVAGLAPRPALHLPAELYRQPASLRFESGREDPDAWLTRWLDVAALRREALDPFPGSGRVLPGLRDPVSDRSLRGRPVDLAEGSVLVVSGSALLGRGLPFDLVVHLHLSPAALLRRTPDTEHWMLRAIERYEGQARPAEVADLVVRADDPRHPALVHRTGPPSERGSQTAG